MTGPRRFLLPFALTFAATAAAHAQAGPYIPLDSRLDRLVAWAIDENLLPGIDPSLRPFRVAAVRRTLETLDTTALTPAARRAGRYLAAALSDASDSTSLVAEAAVAAYTNARRETFRYSDSGGVAAAGGLRATLVRGPLAVVVNPAFDNRLKDDPEYQGYTERFIAGRMQEAYLALAAGPGELVIGRLARNWGPAPFYGLQVSPSAYAFESIQATLRVAGLELTSLAQRLDDHADSAMAPGVAITRWLFAHRLAVPLGGGAWLGLTESGVYGGPGRGFEPVLHAPLNLALLSEFNDSQRVNILLGADFTAPLHRSVRMAAAVMVDDIQVDRGQASEERPASYALSATLQAALSNQPVHALVGYTRVASLAYRNSNDPHFGYRYRNVGLARNFSDYDQWLVRTEARLGAAWTVVLDVTLIRQGSGDLRAPVPPDSVLAQPGQGFLVAPVRRLRGIRLAADGEIARGVSTVLTLGAVSRPGGGTAFIGGATVHVGFDVLRGARGAAWPAIAQN